MRGIGSHAKPYRGGTDEWLTPPEWIRGLGPFDLDPCAPDPRPWNTAAKHYTFRDNGLIRPWHGRVWLNPPYGPQTGVWLERMASHGNGIALVFARTDTLHFRKYVWSHCSAVMFVHGRPHFYLPSGERARGNSGGPIALIAYGIENTVSLRQSGINGTIVRPDLLPETD